MVSGLVWVHHRYGGHSADVEGGHYLVQADPMYRRGVVAFVRYAASFIRAGAASVRLGYFGSVDEAKRVCETSNRWAEDVEAGAIG